MDFDGGEEPALEEELLARGADGVDAPEAIVDLGARQELVIDRQNGETPIPLGPHVLS